MLDNALKRLIGQQRGLENPRIFGAKEEEERVLRGKVAANPEWQRAYGDAWMKIDTVYQELPQKAARLAFSTLTPSRLGGFASTLVRYAEEIARPNEKRLDEFRDSRLESMRLSLLSSAPVYPAMEEAILAAWLEGARSTLGADDPFVRAALENQSAADVARTTIRTTRLTDPAAQRFNGATDLLRDRLDRRPLRSILGSVVEDHPYRPFPNLGGIPLQCAHDSILSRNGVSGNPGAVQGSDGVVVCCRQALMVTCASRRVRNHSTLRRSSAIAGWRGSRTSGRCPSRIERRTSSSSQVRRCDRRPSRRNRTSRRAPWAHHFRRLTSRQVELKGVFSQQSLELGVLELQHLHCHRSRVV